LRDGQIGHDSIESAESKVEIQAAPTMTYALILFGLIMIGLYASRRSNRD
jgi:hypothetical protein